MIRRRGQAMRRALFHFWLMLVGVAAVAVPVWLVYMVDSSPALQAHWQAIAESACKCERAARSGPAGAACWRSFERATHLRHERYSATACFPLSEESACNDRGCFTLRYNIVLSAHRRYICTRDEARAAEAFFYREVSGEGTEAEQSAALHRGIELLDGFARALARGTKLADFQPVPGCASDPGG
jgi:hypothetical protein